MSLYPKTTKMVFLLLQALSEKRWYLEEEIKEYMQIFGGDFLKNSIIIATCSDTQDSLEKCIGFLREDIEKAFGQCPEICTFSEKQDTQDMIDEILEKARNTDTYSNAEIERVQGLVDEEVKH